MIPPSLTEVLARHTAHLMSISGVVGTAEGERDGRPGIVVFVIRKDDAIARAIPAQIEGYPVRIEESGEIGPLR